MAGVHVAKRINSKIETKNAILRLKNGSLRVINREKLNEKFIARIRRERHNFLDKQREIAEAELRKIAADILEDECLGDQMRNSKVNTNLDHSFDFEKELLHEEEVGRETRQAYENWLQGVIDSLILTEEDSEDSLVVCPVCCRQCFDINGASVECGHCCVSYPLSKTVDMLRSDINSHLAEHSDACAVQPQFLNVPDGGGRNSLLILCHVCSYLNVLL